MKRRIAVRKRDIHREEQRRAKGGKPYMLLESDTLDEKGNIATETTEKKPKAAPKKAPAKKKAVAKKKVAPKKAKSDG